MASRGGGRRGGGGRAAGRGDYQRDPPQGGGRGDYQRDPLQGGGQTYPTQQRGRGRGGPAADPTPAAAYRRSPPTPMAADPQSVRQQPPMATTEVLPSSSSADLALLSQKFEKTVNIEASSIAPAKSSGPSIAPAQSSGSSVAPAPVPTVATSGSSNAPTEAPTAPPPASSKALRHPPRPGFGVVGKKMMIRANHFLVHVADNDLLHYDVAITPEVLSRAVNRLIINELVKLFGKSHLGNKMPAYDGRKSLYTAGALPFTSKDFVVKLPEDKGSAKKEKDFKVTIKLAGRADLDHLQRFLKGRQMDAPQETIQVLDIVLRASPSQNYVSVARSFFSPTFGAQEIGDGIECWRGYYQSLRPTQMGLSLNIDISATSFYKSVPVMEFINEYLNLRGARGPLNERDRVKVKKVMRGLRVETNHVPNVIRRYKVTGITPLPLSQLTFPLEDQGVSISVVQYFKERYNCSLSQLSWPCLLTGSESKPTFLPMEVCKIVQGQRYSKKLNERQVTAILRATCKRPPEREESIRKMVVRNNYSQDNFAREFGVQVSDKLATLEARVLPPPTLKYHQTGKEKTCKPSVGQWNMINKRMVNGANVHNWACICFSNTHHNVVDGFLHELVNMCNTIGMVFSPNPVLPPEFANPNRIENGLREFHSKCNNQLARQGQQGKSLQLLIIVLPDRTGSYGPIKRVCETELGILSQCCLPKNIQKNNLQQYLENLSLKINAKTGGRNTVLEDAVGKGIPFVTDKPTIIFGADVTHPAPGEDSSASIAAVVASMDWPEISKYKGLLSAQGHRDEIISDLYKQISDPQKGLVSGGMVRELLLSYYRSTGQKPSRIIFYRDGVSEGQFSQVLLYEMDAIRKACVSLQEGYLPPVTFVVVQKRHHTRLFPAEHGRRDTCDRSGNILPGTVVDTSICHPTEFDFYLCSHAGIQGTSRPTHYHVLYDENRFTADALQMLTNNLCYTYARCTRSVSVVPPAYYAHLAAFRARYYMEGESDGSSLPGSSANTRGKTLEVRPLPQIKEILKDAMFFC